MDDGHGCQSIYQLQQCRGADHVFEWNALVPVKSNDISKMLKYKEES